MRWSKISLFFIISLSGCATFHDAANMDNQASSDITHAKTQYPKVIDITDAPYLIGAEVRAVPPPNPILSETITLVNTQPMSIRQVAEQISDTTGLPVEVTGLLSDTDNNNTSQQLQSARAGLPPPPATFFSESKNSGNVPSINLHYHGTLGGLINVITSQTGLSSKIQNGSLVFFKTETKTFIIPALEEEVSTSSQITASSGATSSSSSSGNNSNSNNSNGTTTITNTSRTDMWSGITKTAQTISDGAQIVTDPSTGTIAVTGTPAQIDQVSAWVQSLSNTLSKQVAITIHIYSVKLNNEQNYGYSPTLAFHNKANELGLKAQGAPVPDISSGATPFTFGATIIGGKFKGTELVVQALSSLGKVSQVFSQSRVTLNGQPASIQVAEQTGYLASVETTSTAQVGSTTSLTPGSVTTGFTGTVTPRVVGDKIYLGMNMVISSLLGLQTVSSGDSSIQVPTTDDTVVNQSAMLQSGSMLMITGYNEADSSNTHNGVGSPYFPLLGGGADASVGRDMVVIVITARIL